MNYIMTGEQKEEITKLLLNIQTHLPWKTARCECEHINNSILGMYNVLDAIKYNTNQAKSNEPRRPHELKVQRYVR